VRKGLVEQKGVWIGKPVRRIEDRRLLVGKGLFVDNLRPGPMLHLAILRSPYAHAKILKIDSSEALKQAGVVTVLTGEDVAKMTKPFPVGVLNPPKYYCMAVDKVRYVGEPVAAVVARDRYVAEDALELIDVEYEPLPAVVDPEEAISSGAPLLHEELGTNVAWHRTLKYGNVDAAFSQADRVVSLKLRFPRYTSAPLEGYGVIASYDEATGKLTIWSNFQGPWTMYAIAVNSLNVPEEKVRHIVPPDIGGGFGIKSSMYPYLVLVAIAAIKAKATVKWIETRREHLMASSTHPDRIQYLEAAIKNDGTVLGIKTTLLDSIGAYIRAPEPCSILRTLGNFVGPYRVQNLLIDAYSIHTNKCPTGPNRGLGCPHLYFGWERLMDTIADILGMDPAEVRFRNLIQPEQMPYVTPTGGIYDSGDYPRALRLALDMIEYDKIREEQRKAWRDGRYIGVGIGIGVDPAVSNMGYVTVAIPPEVRARRDYLPKSGSRNRARVKMASTGKVVVSVDVNPQGQSHETTIAQIVAEELGVRPEDVEVDCSMDSLEFWTVSSGTYSSRFAASQASAVALAARKLKEKILQIASYFLDARVEDLELKEGYVCVRDEPSRAIPLRRIAGAVYWNPSQLPKEIEPVLEATATFDIPTLKPPDENDRLNSSGTYGFVADIAKVEVDIETGIINVLKFVSVHDVGRVLNPMIVEGQVHGSIMHGLGGALYEELIYNDEGQLLTTTFEEYLCPTAVEALRDIKVGHIESPSPYTVLGAKGVAEASSETTPACIANAVEDALKPLGVKIRELPLTQEKVWKLIKEAKKLA